MFQPFDLWILLLNKGVQIFIYCQAQFQQAIAIAIELRQPYNHMLTKPSQANPTRNSFQMLPFGSICKFYTHQRPGTLSWDIFCKDLTPQYFGTNAGISVGLFQLTCRPKIWVVRGASPQFLFCFCWTNIFFFGPKFFSDQFFFLPKFFSNKFFFTKIFLD